MARNTKDIDIMFDEIKTKMIEQAKAENASKIDCLEKENSDLKDINRKLLKAVKSVDQAQSNFNIMNILVNNLKTNIQNSDKKDEFVYKFLDCFFKKDFQENTYEVPLWLGLVTQYYYNRDTIIDVLKMLEFDLPAGIENFRLPMDWTEEELDIIFDTMNNHSNCNGCVYIDNLRFWRPNALKDTAAVCRDTHYSEIPWQFLLRNPLLKKEKYLKQIGKMFCKPNNVYRSSNWLNFARIVDFQKLTDDEIKIILDNVDYTYYDGRNNELRHLFLNNIHLIDNEAFLNLLYNLHSNGYDFKYCNAVLKMPYVYIKQYVNDTMDLNWLRDKKKHFTRDQFKELTLIAFDAIADKEDNK